MRIIAINTIRSYFRRHPETEKALRSWVREAELAEWSNANELKAQFGSASVLTSKRIVFNINGRRYRLIVDIEFRLQIIFIVWFGTHDEYDKIDAKKISYDKTN